MHLRVYPKIFCLYCFCTVYAVAMTSHENRRFSFQTLSHSKFNIKSLIHSKVVSFFSAAGCQSLVHSKNINFIGRECPNFEGMGGSIGTWWEKCHFS